MNRCTYPRCNCDPGQCEVQEDIDEERKRDWNDTDVQPIMEPPHD